MTELQARTLMLTSLCLPQRQSKPEGPKKDPFISDVISYYIRMAQQPVFFTVYFVKVVGFAALVKSEN